jgi:hypothetical protein
VIGRNEGQCLVRCLESVRGQACIPTTDGRELLLTGELLLERLRVTLPAQPLSKIGVAQTANEFRHASAKYPNS